jgi:HEAT repeat protein
MEVKRRLVFGALIAIGLAQLVGCTGFEEVQTDLVTAVTGAEGALRRALKDDDPFTRAEAIEAMVQVWGARSGQAYIAALSDPEPSVRFAACLAIGDTEFASAKPILVEMARFKDPGAEKDERVFCGVLYALYRLGDTDQLVELGRLMFHVEKEVRANAALVIGRMGDVVGIPPLKALFGEERDDAVRLQVLESLAMLGDERSTMLLEAYARKPFLAEKLIAIRALGELQRQRSVLVLQHVLYSQKEPPRARVAAAGALARIGEPENYGYDLCVTSAWKPREILDMGARTYEPLEYDVDSLQHLAAISLGWMGRREAVDVLYPLLRSKNGSVRVAGAMALLRLLPAPDTTGPTPGGAAR